MPIPNHFFCFLIVLVKPTIQFMVNDSLKLKTSIGSNSTSDIGNQTSTGSTKEYLITTTNINRELPSRGYPKPIYMGKSRNKYSYESQSTKMDRTIIGAIIIGCIFLFITLSITVTIIIFCLKKNTVFVFQKSEQEDIHDCTYEDCLDSISYQSSIHCDDNRCSAACNSVPILRRHPRNHRNMCDYFNRCPVELFYPMHYDKPYPIQYTNFRKPSSNSRKCQCLPTNQKPRQNVPNWNRTSGELECEQLPWHKIHDGSVYKPLFKELTNSQKFLTHDNNIQVTLDLVSHNREVIANETSSEKPILDDRPLLQEFIENAVMPNEADVSSTKIVLTPLGKSRTYNELNPQSNPSQSSSDDVQTIKSTSSKRLPKSRSNYESSIKTKRTL